MARYIDANNAKAKLIEWLDSTGALPKGTSYYYECLSCIDDIPTTGVAEVKHGEWVYWQPNGLNHLWKCSVCNGAIDTPMKFVAEHIKYCEHCGAKMDLKEGVQE